MMIKPTLYKEKTLHVLSTGFVFKKVITGGDQLIFDIAPRLPKELKIIIVAPQFTESYWDGIKAPNIEFRFLPHTIFDNKSNPLLIFMSYVIRAWQTYRILRREPVQTIYSCSDVAYADIWPAYLLRLKRPDIKWLSRIYHVLLPPNKRQGNYLVNVIAFRLQRLSFWMMKHQSTTIFALNPKLRQEVLDLGFPNNRLSVLGAGIDFEKVHAFKPTRKYQFDVAVLGRIAPVKGIFDTVQIWKKIHETNPELQLAWIGGGSELHKKKLNEMLKKNSLTESFHLLGYIDKEEVYNILKSARVFLCPDHEIGWGLAVCEAMASGLPVVSYNTDVFGSVYTKGYRSVALHDTDGFADEVIQLLNNETARKKLAEDAINQVRQFDHERVVDTLVGYLG